MQFNFRKEINKILHSNGTCQITYYLLYTIFIISKIKYKLISCYFILLEDKYISSLLFSIFANYF